MLSIAIGALQLMLDRGEQLDWFASAEIIAEASVAGLCLLPVPRPHLHRRATVPRSAPVPRPQFSAGLVFIFLVGIMLLATLALLPPYLQNLMGYPVLTAGMVLAPRGIGTMLDDVWSGA